MRSSPQGRVRYGLAVAAAPALLAATALVGCRPAPPPEQHFYDVHIQPILNASCVGNTSPCHSIAVDPVTNKPTALGNLDLSSFEGVQKRRDVLRTYGSYPQPLLLLKAMPPESNQIPYQGKFYPSEIQHSGGSPIQPNSEAYFELKNWLDNGANRDGIAPQAVANEGVGPCSDALPPVSQRIAVDINSQAYQDFKANIEPMLESSCAYGSCHSSVQADMYLTCGLERRRPGRRDRLQLRAGGRFRDRAAGRPDDDQRRSERDPAAAAGHRRRRREPHGRDLLPVADPTTPGSPGSRGPRRSRPRRRWSTGPRPPGRRSSRRTSCPSCWCAAATSRGATAPTGSTTSAFARARSASSRRRR